jgi:L-lactate utilization protein LutB
MDEAKRSEMREMDWEDHLAAMVKGMRQDAKKLAREFPTKEFRSHTRAARREMLMAVRSLFDDAIERLNEEPAEPKASRIEIE